MNERWLTEDERIDEAVRRGWMSARVAGTLREMMAQTGESAAYLATLGDPPSTVEGVLEQRALCDLLDGREQPCNTP